MMQHIFEVGPRTVV